MADREMKKIAFICIILFAFNLHAASPPGGTMLVQDLDDCPSGKVCVDNTGAMSAPSVVIGDAYAPRPNIVPTLAATAVTIADGGGYNPLWLSSDRRTVFAARGTGVYKSINDGTAWTLIKDLEATVYGIRELDNGELLVSLYGTPGTLQLSTNYPELGATAAWTEVLTAGDGVATAAYFQGGWGMNSHGAKVVVSEYGGTTAGNSARYAYLSEDYGATWAQIYDAGDAHHIHGVAYDPWWDAIWVAWGDTTEGLAVSFDDGSNWTTVTTAYQYTAILPMENCVLLGTDGAPNGIHRIDRTVDRTVGTPVVAYALDSSATITHVASQAFRVKGFGMPAIFPFGSSGTNSGKIISTYDGYNFSVLWTDTITYDTKGPQFIVGPTYSGKIVGCIYDGRQANYSRITFDAPPALLATGIGIDTDARINSAFGSIVASPPGSYLVSAPSGAVAAATRTHGTAYTTPIYIPRDLVLDRIGIEVTSAGSANSVMRLAIYSSNAYGQPTTLVVDAGTVDSTGTGFLEATISQVLPRGLYWLSAAMQGSPETGPTVRCNGAGPIQEIATTSGVAATTGTALSGYIMNGITGAFPAAFTISGTTGTAIRVAVRVQS